MPRQIPYSITLSKSEIQELSHRATKYTLPYFQVQRAKMILLAAEGLSNDEIAARLDVRKFFVRNNRSAVEEFLIRRVDVFETALH
jgi:hypothetical protein